MVKRLSEQLAELSVHTKSAEDAAASARKEAHDKVAALQEQARAAVTTAVEQVDQDIKPAGDSATKNWNAVKAKIAADMTALKADVARTKHHYAERFQLFIRRSAGAILAIVERFIGSASSVGIQLLTDTRYD
jgi:ElaB/YqjD/DUF883 family membrane-anchored ribosome-binding protein